MLAKIELTLSALIYLYNLLVPEIQKFIDADPPHPDLVTVLDQTNAALESLTGEAAWFACGVEGCDHRPFRLMASELADAEGVVSCEYCGRLCQRVPEEKLPRTFLT